MGLLRTESSFLPSLQLVLRVRSSSPPHFCFFRPPKRPPPPKPPDLPLMLMFSPPSPCTSRRLLLSPTNLPPSLLTISFLASTSSAEDLDEFLWTTIAAVCRVFTGVDPAFSLTSRFELSPLTYISQVSLICWNILPAWSYEFVRYSCWKFFHFLTHVELWFAWLPAKVSVLHSLWYCLVNYRLVISLQARLPPVLSSSALCRPQEEM